MKKHIEDLACKTVGKMKYVLQRNSGKLPYIASDGIYDDMKENRINWWTNGFWGGLMWKLFLLGGDERFKKEAVLSEEILDGAFEKYDKLHHDVGFMWLLTSGAHLKIEENEKSYLRTMYAANLLASRYNIRGGYIRAWNMDKPGYSIIDTMMNLALLYQASEKSGDDRYKYIAVSHADMAKKCHVREDGSVYHIVNHNPENGEITDYPCGQGRSANSAWSRGQAWAIYGFAISYIHTKDASYLDTAKKAAHYFISAVSDDYLPRCDFRSAENPIFYDSTAGMIAVCGLLEIANNVSDFEKNMYYSSALKLMCAAEKNFCDFDCNTDGVLTMGTESYGAGTRKNVPIIYGDYFFAEALARLCGKDVMFW